MKSITVLGAGSWGTALAVHLARVGHRVRLWARDPELAADLAARRANPVYLPDVTLPPGVEVEALAADAVAVRAAAPHMPSGVVLVSAAKGLETDTLLRMSEVVAEEAGAGRPVVVLSGPSFAMEVAQQLPTAVLAASADAPATELVQAEFRGPYLRLYGSDDVIGVEIGGAMKNVIAIASGVAEGLGLGHNARAALITRGLAEITRLGVALGAQPMTFAGLAGMGDLILTATGALSRNRTLGVALGQGKTLEQALAGKAAVVEGVNTTRTAVALGEREGVELPIAREVANILFANKPARQAIADLMERELKAE